MKIALVIERMETGRGGRETSTAQMATGLARRGHEVTVICQRGTWSEHGVSAKPLGSRGCLRVQRLKNFVIDVQAAMAGGGYDVVHTTLPVPGADVYQPRGGTIPGQIDSGCRRFGWMGVLRRWFAEPVNHRRRCMLALERRLMSDPNAFCLPGSEMVAQEVRKYYPQKERLRVVFNGVQVPDCPDSQRADWRSQMRRQLDVGPDDPVFLTVASNFPLKGVRESISAFAQWRRRSRGQVNARLVVVGRRDVGRYRRRAAGRGVGGEVVFVPPTDEIFHWYAAADAAVLLSWYDPCSRVVLEATRWGIPSIATTYDGAAEAVDGGGIVVTSPKDTAAIVAAMDELADAGRRSRRAEICRRLGDSLSMARHVDELLDVYSQVGRQK